MKRVLVIGCPGSGKSTFAKALHKATGLPLFHLDLMYWNADKTTVEKSVFLDRLSKALQRDVWIIDGNYHSTMERRMQACDTVVFLDYPTDICLDGVCARKGQARSDMPWVEDSDDDEEFLAFIKNYRTQSRPRVMELLHQYSHKNIVIFSDRTQAEAFLKGDTMMTEFANYNAEVKEKWGNSDAYKEYETKTADYSRQQWNKVASDMDAIFAAFAVCIKEGNAPTSERAQELVKALQAHITENYYLCTNEILVGLGQMYVADERFRQNIDKHADGTAAFVSKAIAGYCG